MQDPANTGRIAATADEDVRVQYRLDVPQGPTGSGDDADTRIGIVVDVAATSRIPALGSIIEISARRFRFDRFGVITDVDRLHRWREDPGVPISSDVARVTGLTDGDVAGRRIDDPEAIRLLGSAAVVIAHSAVDGRLRIERRLEGAGGLAWACSMTQIDWRSYGFDGLSLGYLLRQAGWFYDRNDTGTRVDAVIQLLRHRVEERTMLAILVRTAMRSSWIFRARGAGPDVRILLKERGYRWDADRRVWWREVSDDARIAEEFWLAANVYAVAAGAKSMGPEIEEITARTRFR